MVRIACCQLTPEVDDPRGSAARAREAIGDAIAAGAQVIVLPELAPCGYIFRSREEARAVAEPADGPLLASWASEAARGDAVVIGGFCELAPDGRLFNSAALVDPTGVRAVYRKLHLWNEELLWFERGEDPAPVVATRHGRIGLAVCYDIEFLELTRGLGLAGAEIIAVPTNWPHQDPPAGERPIVKSLAISTAYLNHVIVALCDRGGAERGVRFQGASVIAGGDGAVLAESAPGAATEMLVADGDVAATRDKRLGARNDAFADRRYEHYSAGLLGAAPHPGA
jgi:predicted amidohydrolase